MIVNNFKESDKYRNAIHKLIPGGCHTYSKGDDQFPELSPAAIKKGKGAYLWDIDGNKFLDCSMGLTSVSLGHAYGPVLEAIKSELDNGVNFQRPSSLELETAEKFLSLIPQHDRIKFSKNGSTVTTAAYKLARAKTGRAKIAFPSDHAFFSYDDWFICHTPCDKGIPQEVKNNSLRFNSKDLNTLRELFKNHPGEIACVISEPEKNWGIPDGYLQELISICHENGALYIQDEMVTGFKIDLPGAISKYKSEPDLATWGKGIANGFSFCALTGKKEVMDLGGITNEGEEKVFLTSTTHGGETHALRAAMVTIDEFKKHNVIKHLHETGKKVIDGAKALITKSGLGSYIEIMPCHWQPAFIFKNRNNETCQGFRTLFMQEMIKNGVLFQGIFQPCFSHKDEEVSKFLDAFENSLKTYGSALENGYGEFLVGKPAKGVFRKIL